MSDTSPISTIEPVATVRGLGQIMVRSTDVERTVQFYKEALGFVEAEEQILSPGVTLTAGDASIFISEGAAQRASGNDAACCQVALIVPSARAAYNDLKAAGAEMVDDIDGNEYFASFSIADPDGVIISIWGRP
ncbi:MAG: VOC family protein [bacterium]|nr:VOC family protein [Candidatus Kapabacteria bacterium]